jgi:hypothetical protein
VRYLKIAVLSASVALFMPTALFAQAGTPKGLFACSIGKKTVSVRAIESQLIYEFGTPTHIEMTIIGSVGQGNVFYRSDRYAGMEYQIRFKNGAYSYIVYSMEGNGYTGAEPSSGLVVMKGAKRVADMSCVRHAEFSPAFDYDQLPEDTDEFSAM